MKDLLVHWQYMYRYQISNDMIIFKRVLECLTSLMWVYLHIIGAAKNKDNSYEKIMTGFPLGSYHINIVFSNNNKIVHVFCGLADWPIGNKHIK